MIGKLNSTGGNSVLWHFLSRKEEKKRKERNEEDKSVKNCVYVFPNIKLILKNCSCFFPFHLSSLLYCLPFFGLWFTFWYLFFTFSPFLCYFSTLYFLLVFSLGIFVVFCSQLTFFHNVNHLLSIGQSKGKNILNPEKLTEKLK